MALIEVDTSVTAQVDGQWKKLTKPEWAWFLGFQHSQRASTMPLFPEFRCPDLSPRESSTNRAFFFSSTVVLRTSAVCRKWGSSEQNRDTVSQFGKVQFLKPVGLAECRSPGTVKSASTSACAG